MHMKDVSHTHSPAHIDALYDAAARITREAVATAYADMEYWAAQKAADVVSFVLREQQHATLHGLHNRLLYLNNDPYPQASVALNHDLPFGDIEEVEYWDGLLTTPLVEPPSLTICFSPRPTFATQC